jgi:hypothetical protein
MMRAARIEVSSGMQQAGLVVMIWRSFIGDPPRELTTDKLTSIKFGRPKRFSRVTVSLSAGF